MADISKPLPKMTTKSRIGYRIMNIISWVFDAPFVVDTYPRFAKSQKS